MKIFSRTGTSTWGPVKNDMTAWEQRLQESFHGSKYPKLLGIKKRWDPQGVFYATNAVGSEEWQLGDLIMGHLPSQNSKLCRK